MGSNTRTHLDGKNTSSMLVKINLIVDREQGGKGTLHHLLDSTSLIALVGSGIQAATK